MPVPVPVPVPFTVTLMEAVFVPALAVIVAVPAFLAVTVPSEATEATESSELDHETDAVDGSTVAVSFLVVAPLETSAV